MCSSELRNVRTWLRDVLQLDRRKQWLDRFHCFSIATMWVYGMRRSRIPLLRSSEASGRSLDRRISQFFSNTISSRGSSPSPIVQMSSSMPSRSFRSLTRLIRCIVARGYIKLRGLSRVPIYLSSLPLISNKKYQSCLSSKLFLILL